MEGAGGGGLSKQLRISSQLSLPPEAVTETFAILAKRNAGKTYTASVLVEEMLSAKLQVVVLDPMGAWWGLRSSADGKSEGFPIPILGGDHGDVLIEATAGNVIADLVVDERASAVIDLSGFSKNEWRRFVGDFLVRLYRRNDQAMHVVLEEADLFAPEGKLRRAGDEQMLGAVFDLVRRGRGKGIGCTFITQRSASISKEVLTQAEILIAMRTTGPHDRAAIEEWIRYHGTKDERDLVLGELSGLPTGEAFVWWPVEEILKRVKIRERKTFDSSATPRAGQVKREPKTLADVDLDALQERMAATIEKAKADDPKELRRQVRELEAKATQLEGAMKLLEKAREAEPETVVEQVEVAAISEHDRDVLVNTVADLRAQASELAEFTEFLREAAAPIVAGLEKASSGGSSDGRVPARRAGSAGSRPAPRSRHARAERNGDSGDRSRGPRPVPAPASDEDVRLKAGARRMGQSLALLHPEPLTRVQVATLSDISPKSGTFSDYLSMLKRAGLVLEDGGLLALTEAGLDYWAGALGSGAPSPEQLRDMWGRKLKAGARRMLDALMEANPDGLTREELAEAAEISRGSGTFSDYLSALRRNALAEERSGVVYAGEALFLGARA